MSREISPPALGEQPFHYEVDEGWGALPEGWEYRDVAAVGVDSKDQVYVFSRGEHPMIVFDREGNFLRSWGEDIFTRAHGLHIGPDDMLYCTDDGDHTLRKCTPEGKVELTLGVPGAPAPYMSGEPFHRCTHTALSPENEIYISDGYGNACVHKYSPDGKRIKTWGEPGSDAGQFNIVHNICADPDGWVYVADRENHRVQVFDGSGNYETQWNNVHRPCGLWMENKHDPLCYIGELGPVLPVNRDVPNLGPRISILNTRGELIARLGTEGAGLSPTQFIAPHGLAVDSHGDIYVGEVSYTAWPQIWDTPVPRGLRSLRKLVRTGH